MLNRKTLAALLSLALAGTMAVPAWAAEATPPQRASSVLEPVGLTEASAGSDFQPVAADENPLTRAELISVLHEKEGRPVVNFLMNYTDVEAGDQYAEAIRWASSEKIASGYGNGAFGPDDPVTREQMAVILYQYTRSNDQGFTGAWAFSLDYSDAGEISSFAYEAVCWMTMKHVMGDTGGNLFAPKAEVTHQEANLILEQYFSAVEEVEIPNPFVTCKTMDEAAETAGFSMELPDRVPNWMDSMEIRAVEESMIEVLYQGGGNQLVLRKGIGAEDISGDYNSYSETNTEELNGATVTLKGEDGKVKVAVWCSGDYTYAVWSSAGLDHDAMCSMVSEIK